LNTMLNKKHLLPGKLFSGATIGVISPAGPVSEAETSAGLSLIEGRGFTIRLGRHLYQRNGYLSADDESRLEDLHEMFTDPEVKAVLCARGGYGTMRLLGTLDYNLIRSHPKIIVGYSDITALLLSVWRETGLVGFHGPMIRDCAEKGTNQMNGLMDLLEGRSSPSVPLKGPVIREGTAEGPLVGGNLTMICHLAGTPFMPVLDGCILFLEDRGEQLYRIDRMLTQLALGGHLKRIAGLVTGGFIDCGDMSEIHKMFGEVTTDSGIPVASGLPLGHGSDNIALPIGVRAELNTCRLRLRVTGRWLKE
jgi:muramoyltetrapeptide carboxypeptidase